MDYGYLDNKTVQDIHYHFKYLCDNVHKKSIGIAIPALVIIWTLGNDIYKHDETEILNFFTNYLNARQLSDDDEDLCDDMLSGIYTPATFLMRAQYSSDYIHTMMRGRIDTSIRLAMESLRNVSFFDHKKFTELYVKEC